MRRRRRHSAHHASDSFVKNLVSLFFAFLLSLTFLALTLLIVLRGSVLSERGFLANFNDAYVQSVMTVIRAQTEYYTTPTGIDMSVLEGVFTEEEAEEDIRGLASAALNGREYTPDMTEETARLDANLRSFFEANHLKPETGTIDDVINEFAADINKIYLNTVRFPGMSAIAGVRGRFLPYITPALAALAVTALILILICLKLHHYFHRGLRYIAYAAGAAALMCLVVPGALFASKFYVGFNFQPEYFYHFMVSLVVRLLQGIMMAGIVWLVITIVLAVVVVLRRQMLMRR